MHIAKHLKKWVIFIGTVTTISFFSATNLRAEGSDKIEEYLRQLVEKTQEVLIVSQGILAKVDTLPDHLQEIVKTLGLMLQSWVAPDNLTTTFDLQAKFAALKIDDMLALLNNTQSFIFQMKLSADRFGPPVVPGDFDAASNKQPRILQLVPNINDITYTTLIKYPPAPKAPGADGEAIYNYIKNVGGFNIHRIIPSNGMGGSQDKIDKYKNYYDTIMSIQSYNASVLAELAGVKGVTPAQKELNDMLGDGEKWFSVVAAETPGVVLRQSLMFQSQIYVLLTKLIQTQKDLVMAQTMTNTLLIVANQNNEKMMVMDATGTQGQAQ